MSARSRHLLLLLIALVVAALLPATVAAGASSAAPAEMADCKNGGWQDFTAAGFRNQGDCIRFVQTGTFTCRDPLGCLSYGPEDPVRLAAALAVGGPVSLLGLDSLRGVEIAVDWHGPLLGHDIQLVVEDAMCSVEGGAAAAHAIIADPAVAAIVGTSCSGAAVGAAPIISAAGLNMVSPSNTAPALTDPDQHSPGYLRVAGNDRDQGPVMAEYVRAAGALTSAVVIDGSVYSEGLGQAFVDAFEGLGGTNLAFMTAAPDGSDVDGVLVAIDAGSPDVLFFPVFDPLGSELVLTIADTGLLAGTQLAASDGLLNPGFLSNVGAAASGMLFSTIDFSYTATPEYGAFLGEYVARYGDPTSPFHAMAFDAANMILSSLETVGIVDGAGTLHIGRQALRDSLFATTGLAGLTGTITCGPFGDCGAHGYTVVLPVP